MSSKHFLKPDLFEMQDRVWLLFSGLFKLILFIIMFVIWILGFLNTFPQGAWLYGFIYHIPEILGIAFAFICSYSYYRPIVNIAMIIAIAIFIIDLFALGILLYTVLTCIINGAPSTDCKNTLPANIIISFLAALLALCSFFILWSNIRIAKRLNSATIYKIKQ